MQSPISDPEGCLQQLSARLRTLGCAADDQIYRLSREDILVTLVELELPDLLTMPAEQLADLLDAGERSCEAIDWQTPILTALEEHLNAQGRS